MTFNTPLEDENINSLEKAKFEEVDDLIYVRTLASGQFKLSGLNIAFRPFTFTVTDVAAPLPMPALTNRNSIIIFNKGTETLYIGNSDVTADSVDGSTTSGWQVIPNSFFAIDITDSIILYGVCESGKTTKVQTLEAA